MNRSILSHLEALEAESIHIIREVAAALTRPVMLYDRQGLAGDDPSRPEGLLSGAAPLPHPPRRHDLEVCGDDPFSRRVAGDAGVELLVWTNPEGKANNINPFEHGTQRTNEMLGKVREVPHNENTLFYPCSTTESAQSQAST